MQSQSGVRRGRLFSVFLASSLLVPLVPLQAQVSPEYEATLNRVLQRPADAEASFLFAQTAASSGNFREAIAALERVLILYPDLANIKLELGVLYLRTDQNALAQRFISEALASPDVPPEVEARGRELLDVAERRDQRFDWGAGVSIGMSYDSNANSGPESGVAPEDTAAEDASGFLRLNGRFSYDLGTQAGHRLVGRADFFSRRYAEQSQINLDRLGASLGVLLNLAPEASSPRTLRLTVDAAQYWRDGEDFLFEVGPTARLGFALSDTHAAEISASWRSQDYSNTSDNTVNELRDGEAWGLAFDGRMLLAERQILRYGLGYEDKSADAEHEAYEAIRASIGYSVIADPLFSLGSDDWRYSVSASYAVRNYNAFDPRLGPSAGAEEAAYYSLTAATEVPFENDLSLLTEIGVNGNDSTYDFNDFDNAFVSFTINKDF